MPSRRAQLRAWLLAMTRFELQFRVTAARTRNAYIKAAASAYEQNHTLPGWLKTAHQKRIADALAAHYQAVIPHFGAMALKQIKSRRVEKKDYLSLASQWVTREALRKATMIAATDQEDVRGEIADGITAGLGAEEIARNIRKVTGLTPFRAATVARTETHAAATFGSIESVRQAEQELGVVMSKEWLATRDDRTRPEHLAADGQRVGLNERFDVGGEMMDRPGDPSASPDNLCNCRCSILFNEAQ